MHNNKKPAPTQFQLFPARPSKPPLRANVSPRLLHLLVRLLRGAQNVAQSTATFWTAVRSEKIRPNHLQRKAILYVRQSSAYQVTHNLESHKLQYAMQERLPAQMPQR